MPSLILMAIQSGKNRKKLNIKGNNFRKIKEIYSTLVAPKMLINPYIIRNDIGEIANIFFMPKTLKYKELGFFVVLEMFKKY